MSCCAHQERSYICHSSVPLWGHWLHSLCCTFYTCGLHSLLNLLLSPSRCSQNCSHRVPNKNFYVTKSSEHFPAAALLGHSSWLLPPWNSPLSASGTLLVSFLPPWLSLLNLSCQLRFLQFQVWLSSSSWEPVRNEDSWTPSHIYWSESPGWDPTWLPLTMENCWSKTARILGSSEWIPLLFSGHTFFLAVIQAHDFENGLHADKFSTHIFSTNPSNSRIPRCIHLGVTQASQIQCVWHERNFSKTWPF